MSLSFEDSLNAAKAAEEAELDLLIAASQPNAAAASEDYSISTLDETFGGIAAYSGEENWTRCPGDTYKYYSVYSDDKMSTIRDDKTVDLNIAQYNVTQESNSQFIPFIMPRKYDGFDFIDNGAVISIHYTRSDGAHGTDAPINVFYNEDKIKFGWLLDSKATKHLGKIQFEIHATGTVIDDNNTEVGSYLWKTRTNDKLTVFQSICPDNEYNYIGDEENSTLDILIEKVVAEAAQKVVDINVQGQVDAANAAANRAESFADAAENTANEFATRLQPIEEEISNLGTDITNINKSLSEDYATNEKLSSSIGEIGNTNVKAYVDAADTSILSSLNTKIGDIGESENVIAYVDAAVDSIDISDKLGNLMLEDEYGTLTEATVEEYVNAKVDGVDVTEQLGDYYKKSETYSQTEIDNKNLVLTSNIQTNATNIQTANSQIALIKQTLEGIDTSAKVTYEATYGDVVNEDTGETQNYMFTLWEKEGEAEATVKSRFQIMGGGGGSGSGAIQSFGIKYVEGYETPIVVTAKDPAIVQYEFFGRDSAEDTNLDGTASWKVGNRIVANETVSTGINEFDLTQYLAPGDNKVVLTITHATGAVATKAWTVKIVDVRLEPGFDATKINTAGEPVNFTFTPYGGIDKTLHFLLDGKEIATKTSYGSAAGLSDYYAIPAQKHGTHLFEVYMTANINGKTVESNHIVEDVIWYDANATSPVIACSKQQFTARQYETTNIEYTVYDPSTETPTVSLKSTYVDENGETVEEYNKTLTLGSAKQTWSYKADVIGEHTLTITCGDVVKTLKANIVELGINITPVTAGLAFDFNPVGYSNDDVDRLWNHNGVDMTVSDNFDWVNGGYQMDANGDQYFCIKAGTRAQINYELFGDDAKSNGKEFKLVFKTENVADSSTTFLSCVSDTIGTDKIGIEMKALEANIYAKTEALPLPYAEEEIIEFEFNITSSSESVPMCMGYEDGVSTRPLVYDATHDFQQYKDNRVPIVMGSDDCDLHIYRFKVYNTSLSDRDILNNFIADSRSAEEMIKRYDRNQIYKDGILDPDHLAEVCPWLRVIKLEVPRFTKDKDDKVGGTNIEYIYKDGDPVLDNWYATDCAHSGQGTSSNSYGPAGRNLDLILKTHKDVLNNPTITLGDGVTTVKKVSLTRDSVDTNYFNVKVNIASSENANNALLQKRYNTYNPYTRPIVRENPAEAAKVKDTMEFYNCVIFLREYSTTETHTEFADDNWHFYAIGNIGDSKKTDSSRLTDPDDPYECILEVMDNTLSNSTMPTGKVDENGAPVYPISPSEWTAGNAAYDTLHADLFDEVSAKDKENGLADTYGWRYIYEYDDKKYADADERNAEVKAFVEGKWKEFYEFVVTSTDEEFKANLGNYCVLESILYYYLFTLRYTMTDNHAKNSFWHYGKSNDKDADGNAIRKWDLCFDYDNDTALGIDNYGRMSYRYGYEEIDYVDGTNDWVWNAPQHVLFLRIRELFDEDLCALYQRLESLDCWSADSLINQFNAWQGQFPEELWRLDIERKYIRTYTGSYINGGAYPEFLKERANGRKKSQRSQFERNQEKYIASKFRGIRATTEDQIYLRCSAPNTNLVVKPNYDITLTPYSYVYLSVGYNTDNKAPERVRAVPGQQYTFKYNAAEADIIYIYSASSLKSFGDLSAMYLTNCSVTTATKIRELILGNDTPGYVNTNTMTLGFGNNNLLNKIDVQNMTGLTSSLDLTGLRGLEELYADGSGISGVLFADGGNIMIADIPDVGSISMKNLAFLDDDGFDVASYNKLTWLIAENSKLDLISLIENSPNLRQVRLTGIDWRLDDVDLLARLYELQGIKADGSNNDYSVLAGKVYVNTIKQQELYDYQAMWPDLEIEYTNLVSQHKVTFVDDDDTILDVQHVVNGEYAFDPIGVTIDTPTKESTVSTNYTFAGWNVKLETVQVFADMTVKATYSEATREYTIRYLTKTPTGTAVIQSTVAPYGTYVDYEGETPTYTSEEGNPTYTYYLFDGWKESGYVSGDKDIEARWSKFTYTGHGDGGFVDGDLDVYNDLANLTPVKIYALDKLVQDGVISIPRDTELDVLDTFSFTMGHDVDYSDIRSEVVIDKKTSFDGTNHYKTDISLFDEDKDFVLAVDYRLSMDCDANGVLMQCFKQSDYDGFKLSHSNGAAKFEWGSSSTNLTSLDCREMLVLRHKKGSDTLTVYNSNLGAMEISISNMTDDGHNPFNNQLVFGCAMPTTNTYRNYAKGDIYWCKVWYADLGDDACKKLAGWPHEELSFELCSLGDYFVSGTNGEQMCNFTLLATHLLDRQMRFNTKNTNVGGWSASSLNQFLNTRMYNALPTQIKAIVKKVNVESTAGGGTSNKPSTGLVRPPAECYIFVPAAVELGYRTTTNGSAYDSEGIAISFITEDPIGERNAQQMRQRQYLNRTQSEETLRPEYYLRTPYVTSDKYVFRVDDTGNFQVITQPDMQYGVLVMMSF